MIVDKIKRHLADRFPTKDLGSARLILGYEIERDRSKRNLILHQNGYMQSML